MCDVISIVATGRYPTTITIPIKDERELDKTMDSIFLAGDQIAVIDNIETLLSSSKLNSALTQNFVNVRILGKSGLVRSPSRTMWILNGNNVEISWDISRRTLKSRIVPNCENPEDKIFIKNLKEYALKNRIKIINSIFSIISYTLKDKNKKIVPLGSYYEWSTFVRYPINTIWGRDVVESKSNIKTEDPYKAKLMELMECWESSFPNGGTVRDAIKSKDFEMIDCLSGFKDKYDDVSAKQIGNFIKKARDREINGKYFKKIGEYKHNAIWSVLPITPF
jgi:hypothetical protein